MDKDNDPSRCRGTSLYRPRYIISRKKNIHRSYIVEGSIINKTKIYPIKGLYTIRELNNDIKVDQERPMKKTSVKSFDYAEDNLHVVVYNFRPYAKEETVKNSRSFCDEGAKGKNYKYDLFDNNCEHFATYCVTG